MFFGLQLAPRRRNSLMCSTLTERQARWSGVMPNLSAPWMSSSIARKEATSPSWPYRKLGSGLAYRLRIARRHQCVRRAIITPKSSLEHRRGRGGGVGCAGSELGQTRYQASEAGPA